MEQAEMVTMAASVTDLVASLLTRLQHLESQQLALLHSFNLTDSTITTLPSTIAPTFQKLPVYTTRLSNLKSLMATQTATVAQLQRRADDVKGLKERNAVKIEQVWERERERDRGELRARRVLAVSEESEEVAVNDNVAVGDDGDDVAKVNDRTMMSQQQGEGRILDMSKSVTTSGTSRKEEEEEDNDDDVDNFANTADSVSAGSSRTWMRSSQEVKIEQDITHDKPMVPAKMIVKRKKKVRRADIGDS